VPTDPEPNDHYRPTDAGYPAGVYRVVGTGDPVALLVVGDADGNRVVTGRVVAVSRAELSGFDPAENPDTGGLLGGLLARVRGLL